MRKEQRSHHDLTSITHARNTRSIVGARGVSFRDRAFTLSCGACPGYAALRPCGGLPLSAGGCHRCERWAAQRHSQELRVHGLATQGETLEEAREMARDAIMGYLESLAAHSEPVPVASTKAYSKPQFEVMEVFLEQ
jgi:hypothetical protein